MSPRRDIPGHGDSTKAADDIAGFVPGDEADDEDAIVDEPEAAPASSVDLPFTSIDWTAHAGDADGKVGAEVIQTLVRRLPNAPGVYRMMNAAGDVLYVGKARSLKKRVTNYANGRFLHLLGNLGLHLLAAARKEILRLRHQFGIVLRGDLAGARPRTALDLVEKARPGPAFEDRVRARPEQEGALQ